LIDFLDWVARAGGIVSALLVLIGFLFREKWKQILQRSLAEDLERLKSELAKSQTEHAASLTPQLEQIKHDFQQKLEAYKVSLIAETEAVKAKGELRKSIALRYSEIEFERLITLEHVMAPIASELLAMAAIDVKNKTVEHGNSAIEQVRALGKATDEAEMFMSSDDRILLIEFRRLLLDVVNEYVGYEKTSLSINNEKATKLLELSSHAHDSLKVRIREFGKI